MQGRSFSKALRIPSASVAGAFLFEYPVQSLYIEPVNRQLGDEQYFFEQVEPGEQGAEVKQPEQGRGGKKEADDKGRLRHRRHFCRIGMEGGHFAVAFESEARLHQEQEDEEGYPYPLRQDKVKVEPNDADDGHGDGKIVGNGIEPGAEYADGVIAPGEVAVDGVG